MSVVPLEPPGRPVADAKDERPPIIRRTELVAFALVAILLMMTIAGLYVAKPFFLPIVTAFIVGTMLSPAANWLEKRGLPRPLAAVLIVVAAAALVGFMATLIASPVLEWGNRLPELGAILKEKLHAFDRITGLWRQVQGSVEDVTAGAPAQVQFPKIEWMQPTFEFVSPTLTEIMLFLVTLLLFIATWKNLRRALVMMFAERETRLRTLRILNEIESNLGGYLLTVTVINLCYGTATGLICAVVGMPNPAALGALAAILNFIPIIGPFVTFFVLTIVGIVSFPNLGSAMLGPAAFAGMTFLEGHFITPTIIGRRLSLNALAVFVALAFWTWLWGPMGGFLSSPMLIVALVVKEHLMPDDGPNLPGDSKSSPK